MLAIAVAAPAGAATVSVKNHELNYKAAGGEANRVLVDIKANVVTVRDSGAHVTASRGCDSVSAFQVVCRTRNGEFDRYNLALRDRGDHATLVQRGSDELGNPIVTGGRGDDVVRAGRLRRYGFFNGGPGDDRITGTSDGDAISGGAGRDVLIGGEGADQFVTDPAGAAADDDLVRGGRGPDEVSYSRRTRPISIDLRRSSPQGSAGEKDVFHSVEGVTGTVRNDRLLGNAAENDLQGIGGRDVIEGFAGNDRVWSAGGKKDTEPDTISGGRGRDVVLSEGGGTATGGPGADELQGSGMLDGGAGDDTFEPAGGRVKCGGGSDTVSIHNVKPPLLLAACESADLGKNRELSITLPLERGESEIVAPRISCDQEDGATPDGALCTNELRITLGDQLLASGTFDASEEDASVHMAYKEGAKDALGTGPKQVRATVGRYSFDSLL